MTLGDMNMTKLTPAQQYARKHYHVTWRGMNRMWRKGAIVTGRYAIVRVA
jgi:hypothetical protein